jgi:GNAT superfamily N-acetyltransferase
MIDAATIRRLEEAGLAGLPALRTDVVDGWMLRFADGYSRRANSVQTLYPSTGELSAGIDGCERAYARQGLPCLFKVSPASPHGLDDLLDERGYARDGETVVCTRALDGLADTGSAPGDGPELHDGADGEWLAAWALLTESHEATGLFGRLLAAVPGPAAYALVRDGDATVGCARATMSGEVVGLNDLIVCPAHRRRGHASALTTARLAWAARLGARVAFLQVLAGNDDARRLQERLGFSEAYRYWYRVQPGSHVAGRC